jgi:glutamate N-acetyltransferase/amino-acid N-acetyltransferase
MKVIKGGITAARGFEANGIACGLKSGERLDLAFIYSKVPAKAVALFTKNKFFSSSIALSKENLKKNLARAIIINSGNANCAVGKAGLSDARKLTHALAGKLGIPPGLVLMASTGIIGKRLPVEKIKQAIPGLVRGKTKARAHLAARAIMTTDTKPKEIAVEIEIAGRKVKIGAMAKGAGMISPDMATMLCFVATDADIEAKALKQALSAAVKISFNRISVDGDMSTNDSVIVLANGLAKNKKIILEKKKDFFIFTEALGCVCRYLAKQIILDGEGATKFIQIKVRGAKNDTGADKIAREVANSPLFKCAMYGEDPNWGRVVAACGRSGVRINPEKLEIRFDNTAVFKNGLPIETKRNRLKNLLKQREVELDINLHQGKAEGFIWTTDLTEEYVRINTRYE